MKQLLFNCLLILTLLGYKTANAQDSHVIDSLKIAIAAAKHDTTVCRAYLDWGEEIYRSNPDTALIIWLNAQDIAEINLAQSLPEVLSNRYSFFLAMALNGVGMIHYYQGDLTKALEYHSKSLYIRERISWKLGVATSWNNIALCYYQQGDIQKALKHFLKSSEIREEIGDRKKCS